MITFKKIPLVLLSSFLGVLHAYSQGKDSVSNIAASYFREAEQAAKNQKLWSASLYGPTVFVDVPSRKVWANMPDGAGLLKREGAVYTGLLPKNIIPANTAFNWNGRKWSMILWPLPQDHDDRLNLILHESFHRIQDSLALKANSPTVNHLSTMNGRIYFLLELQALKAALNKPVNRRKHDLESALLFREKRHLLFPETFGNEQLLEMNEGLAEYTGVMLGRKKDSIKTHLDGIINDATAYKSLIRSMAYITGPVYGYLLYQANPIWSCKVSAASSFPSLIETYYHISPATGDVNMQVKKITDQYNGKKIIASESAKEEAHQKQVNAYVDLFTKKPVLTIALTDMNIGFNPGNLFDLDSYGTVYPTAQVTDNWGEVKVTEDSNGMLMKDWKVIYLPVTPNLNISGSQIDDKGWKLTLKPGWKMVKADASHYKLQKD